jgi:hypothetical protein
MKKQSASRIFAILFAASAIAACLPSGTRGGGTRAAQPAPTTGPSMSPAGPTPRPTIVPPTPTPAPTFLVVTVKQGDSLNTIAHHYGTTARSIAFWNRSAHPSLDPESPTYKPGVIKVGWTLSLIPNRVIDEDTLEPVESESLS